MMFRLLVLPAVVLMAAGCAASTGDTAGIDPAVSPGAAQKAVISAHRSFIQAFEAGDVESLVGLMDNSGDLLIFHPMTEDRFDGVEEARAGLGRMFAKTGGATLTVLHPSLTVRGDAAWITSHVLLEPRGTGAPFVGRGTEVWVRRGSAWRLAHAHWSENPESEPRQRASLEKKD